MPASCEADLDVHVLVKCWYAPSDQCYIVEFLIMHNVIMRIQHNT